MAKSRIRYLLAVPSCAALMFGIAASAAFISGTAAFAAGAGEGEHKVVSPDSLEWKAGPPSLPPGPKFAVLQGSPAEQGPFVIRIQFPADFRVPPHWHSKDEHLTILSGTFNVGMGEKADREAGHPVPAGGFVLLPAKTKHYAWTEEEVTLQLHGMGPFDINYVDPKDDPRGDQQAQKK